LIKVPDGTSVVVNPGGGVQTGVVTAVTGEIAHLMDQYQTLTESPDRGWDPLAGTVGIQKAPIDTSDPSGRSHEGEGHVIFRGDINIDPRAPGTA
jgi:hypothetical protein